MGGCMIMLVGLFSGISVRRWRCTVQALEEKRPKTGPLFWLTLVIEYARCLVHLL